MCVFCFDFFIFIVSFSINNDIYISGEIHEGDVIVSINGKSTVGKKFQEVTIFIYKKGAFGSFLLLICLKYTYKLLSKKGNVDAAFSQTIKHYFCERCRLLSNWLLSA